MFVDAYNYMCSSATIKIRCNLCTMEMTVGLIQTLTKIIDNMHLVLALVT